MAKPTITRVNPEPYWKVPEFKENGKIYTAKVFDNLSKPMNYEQLQKFYTEQKEQGNPYPISLPTFMQIAKVGMESGNAEFMNFLNQGLKQFPNFFSSIIYSPIYGKNKIIHYEATPKEYSFLGEFVGPDGWIKNIHDTKTLASLTGIDEVSLLNEMSNSINSTPMYLWRFNSKPNKEEKRVVRLYSCSYRLDLYASRVPSVRLRAFRVLLEEQDSSK